MENIPEIEAYEPYHLGIKMKQMLDLNFVNKFRNLLSENNFDMLIESQERKLPPILDIAQKNNTIIQINFPGNSINVFGDDPKNVGDIQDKVIELFDNMGIDITFAISFYELIGELSIKTYKNPYEVLENKIKWDMDEFENLNASITGLKVSTTEAIDEMEYFEFTIEPKVLSPKNRYHSRIFRRSRNIDKIKDLQDNIESIVTRAITQIERCD